MNRVKSWVVLIIGMLLSELYVSLMVRMLIFIVEHIPTTTLGIIALYVGCTSVVLPLLFVPVYPGIMWIYLGSELMKPSKKGTRYTVVGATYLIWFASIMYLLATGKAKIFLNVVTIYWLAIPTMQGIALLFTGNQSLKSYKRR